MKPNQIIDFRNNRGIFIGDKLRQKLNIRIGDRVSIISSNLVSTPFGELIRNANFTIVGIFQTGMFEYDVSLLVFPLTLLQDFLGMGDYVDNLEIRVDNYDLIQEYKNDLQALLSSQYFVTDWREINPSLFNAIEVEKNVMFLILFLIVLVAAFNLISSMVMLVNNKRKDIGILKMIGFSKLQILKIFMINGFLIGLIGTLSGLILGLIFCFNINEIKEFIEGLTNSKLFSEEIYFFSRLPMIINFEEVFFIVTISIFLSFLATIYPSYKASNVQPINLIKWE